MEKRKTNINKIKEKFNSFSKEKQTAIIAGTSLFLVFFIFFIASGLKQREDILLMEYEVYGNEIIIDIELASSSGYTRGYKIVEWKNAQYLTFYSTFGETSIGSKKTFKLKTKDNCKEIYFNRVNGEYELILKKNKETGEWEQIKK